MVAHSVALPLIEIAFSTLDCSIVPTCGAWHSVALPLIEIAFWILDCSIVPTCGAWGSATAAKRGPLKQSLAGIQHSRDDEPLGLLMQMRNVRVNGFFFFDLRSAQVYCVAFFLTC